MAVYAAHLTRTLQGTPSIFQVTAQDSLGATVKPAIRKLIEYLAAAYPNRCGWCERWYDELYLLFDCCVQYHYLKHYAASFSECFYGLLRVPVSPSSEFSSGTRLPVSLERGSLALLVLMPYLRDRIQAVVDRWREDHEDGRLSKSTPDRARIAAIKLYAVIHTVSDTWKFVQLARYLTGAASSPTPPLQLLDLTLKNAPPSEPDEDTWSDFFKNMAKGDFGSAVVTFPMVWRVVSGVAEYGAFGVQFLRWWEARAPALSTALPPPAPPQRDERASRSINKCPICLQKWKVPTVLPVSGIIFCYGCISREVRARGACPVSRLPAHPRDLVRLYLQ